MLCLGVAGALWRPVCWHLGLRSSRARRARDVLLAEGHEGAAGYRWPTSELATSDGVPLIAGLTSRCAKVALERSKLRRAVLSSSAALVCGIL